MNEALFEQLLYEEESDTLDFKKEQYRFVKATEDEKAELLKDILGFLNAWRRTDAYILIGVEDVRGTRANVVGISTADQLTDHSLQQFVNYLINRPARFHYEAFSFEGKQVGIIRIEAQPRPIYLKKDYGPLKEGKVYVRRGSSTDPQKPASPDEIAQMGHGPGPQIAELAVEFADVKRDSSLGTSTSWDAEFCEMPPAEQIPSLPEPSIRHFGLMIGRLNENYFQELAGYEFSRRCFRPARLVLRNIGQVTAESARVELTIPSNIGVAITYLENLPRLPERRIGGYPIPPNFPLPAPQYPGDVSIDRNDERFRIEIDFGDLQPGRSLWSNVFYVGKRTSGDLVLSGRIFAGNLPQPKEVTLTVSVKVTNSKMTSAELCALPEPKGEDD